MPVPSSDHEIDNSQWSSYKKQWIKLKIVRNDAKKLKDPELIHQLKEEEIEISKKIVQIAPYLTDGKGKRITVPVFPLLMGIQK